MRHFNQLFFTSLLLGLLFLTSGCLPSGKDVEVNTLYGTLVGKEASGLQTFLGIPYAKPPIGSRRWLAPEPPYHWFGKRRAFRQSRACVQAGSPTGAIGSIEDCLYLNVWAPVTEGPHPVMVWIHGGGLIIGSANEFQYDGGVLAKDQDVIVVSMNYRLGYMGYLTLPQFENNAIHTITGNQGFLDQIAALQWVQDNIAQFGGDPANVTVFGESAGSISTCLLLASPLTDNLMHKAIMQSGACSTFNTATQSAAQDQGINFLELIGCGDAPDPVQCAQSKSADYIKYALGIPPNELFRENFQDWVFPPNPALDGYFLPDRPMNLLEISSKHVPIMLGTNKDEGTLFVGMQEHSSEETAYLENLEKYYSGRSAEIAALYPLADYHPAGAAMAQIVTDAAMTCPSRQTADIWSAKNDTFFYHFTQPVSAPLMNLIALGFTENAAPLGTFHASEIPYVFGIDGVLGEAVTGHQRITRNAMMQYWGNFARTGNPNGDGLSNWPPYSQTDSRYLQINQDFLSGNSLRQRYCEYWRDNPATF